MMQNSTRSTVCLLTATKASLFKAVLLSTAMLAFGSTTAYAATETCRTLMPESWTSGYFILVNLVYEPEVGEYIECSSFTPGVKKYEETYYKGEHFTINPVGISGGKTGWMAGDSGSRIRYTCSDMFGRTCEFNIEGHGSKSSYRGNTDDKKLSAKQ